MGKTKRVTVPGVAETETETAAGELVAGRLTQAQRRARSQQAVLESACRLFGERGYANTSLEEIAADCGLTIRPIYHYFGNKKALFAAVNQIMEARIVEAMDVGEGSTRGAGLLANWRAYLALCDDPAFRQIVLKDSPNILGRERWATSPVTEKARSAFSNGAPEAGNTRSKALRYRSQLMSAVVLGAFTEVALTIADADDVPVAKREAERLIAELFDSSAD